MPVRIRPLPALQRLRELFIYAEDRGELYHKKSNGPGHAGAQAGWIAKTGYRLLSVDGKDYQTHRIIWKMHYGTDPGFLDHKQGKLDNRITNLREATHSQNACNTRRRSDNHSGVKGITLDASRKKQWRATIMVNQKYIHIGRFHSRYDAIAALSVARARLHGEFARVS